MLLYTVSEIFFVRSDPDQKLFEEPDPEHTALDQQHCSSQLGSSTAHLFINIFVVEDDALNNALVQHLLVPFLKIIPHMINTDQRLQKSYMRSREDNPTGEKNKILKSTLISH